jgi:hypothetical protein
MLNYQTIDFMAGQLADQYEKQKAAGFSYPNEDELPKFFRAQAAKLAANNVTSIYDVQEADGGIINSATGEAIKDVVLKPTWQEDPEAYRFRNDVKLEDRGGFTRWGKDLSVQGQADYGLNFVDGVPVYTPFWKDTSTDMGTILLGGALIAGGLYGLSTLGGAAAGTAGTGAAAGTTAATSTALPGSLQAALPGLGVETAATTALSTAAPGSFQAALPGLLSTSAAGAPIYFADAVPANELAFPAREVAANYTPVPGSFQEVLPSLGVETAASAAPFTAAPGSFQAALPSLLGAGAGLSLLDGLKTAKDVLDVANTVDTLLNPPSQTQQPQQQRQVMGGQPRGVDFSPLYRNTIVGLLPGAERFRRSLI